MQQLDNPLEIVELSTEGRVAIVTLNKASTRNAMSPEMVAGLTERFEGLVRDSDCRAIVLTGANGAFCAGGDISRMVADRPILATRAWMGQVQRLIRLIVAGSKPVVAAVEGAAAGAGLALTAASDFAVAASNARFLASFGKVGIAPDSGTYWSLAQRIGVGNAKRILMLSSTLDASSACRIGLVDEVVEPGNALRRAMEIAGEFAAAAPLPIAVIKSVYAQGCADLESAFQAERDHHPYLVLSDDHLGAVKAFREKRKPEFSGK